MFVNGDFEDGLNGWSYDPNFVTPAPGYGVGGSVAAQIHALRPDSLDEGAISQQVDVVPGVPIDLTFWLWGWGASEGDEVWVEWNEDIGYEPGFQRAMTVTLADLWGLTEPKLFACQFTPMASPIEVRWRAHTVSMAYGIWYWLDDAAGVPQVVDIMAVLLGEFAVPAMLKTLQDNLATEVAAINTERSDAEVQLSSMQRWYCYEREWASPDINECEVYIPPDGISFPRMPSQLSRWVLGQRVPIDSDVEIVVAINHANRGGVSGATLKRSDMWKLNQRYAAAVCRVVRNFPNLGYANDLVAVPQRVRTESRRVGNEDTRFVDRVEVVFSVSQQESSSGENTPGGGVPPVAVLES